MFDRLDGFEIGDYGLFWAMIRHDFPTTEAQPPLEPVTEQFEGFRPDQFTFRLVDGGMMPRTFYHSADGCELVQVQSDRFAFNWRGGGTAPYPHSEQTMKRFNELFAIFEKFAAERGFPKVQVRQCELVNVNIVPVDEFGKSFADAPEFFRVPEMGRDIEFLRPETYISSMRHLIEIEGKPVGRLYSALSPVTRIADDDPAYRLELTARGAPIGGDTAAFFDIARSAINAVFLSATTKKAREHWGEQ
ncbi:hypothetical protein CMV14_02795 [Rhizorhabdus dicambivorans]|nr:hypothetical protein [Rhizorhabdus dicambivorans]ATE63463.1 hypothetical protein CMV14_02795 [Rhizorhabdus dicambivorans]